MLSTCIAQSALLVVLETHPGGAHCAGGSTCVALASRLQSAHSNGQCRLVYRVSALLALQVFEEGCPDMCARLGLKIAVTSHRGIHMQPDTCTGRLVRVRAPRAPPCIGGACGLWAKHSLFCHDDSVITHGSAQARAGAGGPGEVILQVTMRTAGKQYRCKSARLPMQQEHMRTRLQHAGGARGGGEQHAGGAGVGGHQPGPC